ncbi:MAG: NAD-dependent epimerase/dehydratase family protein [Pirellulales bacterium]|nr:NAD-dependent epimerase/dehydratase family protein [Pirellulales bacterium]
MNKHDLIVITGAGGFIGGALTRYFRDKGFTNVRAVDIKRVDQWYQTVAGVESIAGCDLKIKENCYRVCRGATEVYNFAADMGGMGFIELHRAACMLSVLINTHMLMAARDSGTVQRYFFSSSACVYNTQKQQQTDCTALKEEDAYPAMAEEGYGWEKLFGEQMCRHFMNDYGLETHVARFHNVYGPHGTWDGGREKAPAAICRKVIEAKDTGSGEIEIWGDGKQSRSFMYIDDCLQGIDMLMHSEVREPLNLGSSELISINRLVELSEEIAGVKLRRTYKLDAPKGVRGRNSDNTRIRERFDWEPNTPFSLGLAETYAWIQQQYFDRKAGKCTVC